MRFDSSRRFFCLQRLTLLVAVLCAVVSCRDSGGSSGGETPPPAAESVVIDGTVTYDRVPVGNPGFSGLNYNNTQALPVRGVVVELLDAQNRALDSTVTDSEGFYSLSAPADTPVRVSVLAQLLRESGPAWNKKVTDNTSGHSVYSLDGELVSSGAGQQRHLHAASGWTGAGYGEPRAAGPFAILDSIYSGLEMLLTADSNLQLPPLQVRWSPANRPVVGSLSQGEIGTSFFDGTHIYLLGAADVDTDEYDVSVVLHEWAHYLEAVLFRSDSLGGSHTYNDYLDLRVAYSEGFANAFSGMVQHDPIYWDSWGEAQSLSFAFDMRDTAHQVRGWYAEASVDSVFYNYFDSDQGKTRGDFAPIYQVMSSQAYRNSNAMASIFLFAHFLNENFPAHMPLFTSLLAEQDINSLNKFGEGETNDGPTDGALAFVLPVYKTIQADDQALNVCSSSIEGAHNKLGIYQLIRLPITVAGTYTLRMERNGGDAPGSDPDFYVYRSGNLVAVAESALDDVEILQLNLTPGEYLIEAYDWLNVIGSGRTSCFDVQVSH